MKTELKDECFASTIYDMRKRAGLSQIAVASALGVTVQAVSQWESGDTVPTMKNWMAFQKLVGGDDSPVTEIDEFRRLACSIAVKLVISMPPAGYFTRLAAEIEEYLRNGGVKQ